MCHGISGNSYFVMRAYLETGDEKWRKRAYGFLMTAANPEIHFVQSNYLDSGFKVKGTPDTPFSLMEGCG